MEEEKIKRINALAKKTKTAGGLTEEEAAEQKRLREEYIAAYRRNLEAQLNNTYILDEKGNKARLKKKNDET